MASIEECREAFEDSLRLVCGVPVFGHDELERLLQAVRDDEHAKWMASIKEGVRRLASLPGDERIASVLVSHPTDPSKPTRVTVDDPSPRSGRNLSLAPDQLRALLVQAAEISWAESRRQDDASDADVFSEYGVIADEVLATASILTEAAAEQVDTAQVWRDLSEDRKRLRAALSKINDIRNDIIGRQMVGFSKHIYPLVAALDEAGYVGAGYVAMRAKVEADDAALLPYPAGSRINSNLHHDADGDKGTILGFRDTRPKDPVFVYRIRWDNGYENERLLHRAWTVTPPATVAADAMDDTAREVQQTLDRFQMNGLVCSLCGLPQHETPSGATCANQHGGAPGRQVGLDEGRFTAAEDFDGEVPHARVTPESSEDRKTVRIRACVAVGASGDWSVLGWTSRKLKGPNGEHVAINDEEARSSLDMDDPVVRYSFIEADVPTPDVTEVVAVVVKEE